MQFFVDQLPIRLQYAHIADRRFKVARAGAFSANFAPEVLDNFRDFCAGRGEKYTKVLEKLAIFYMGGGADIVEKMFVPELTTQLPPTSTSKLVAAAKDDQTKRIARLEENNEYFEETIDAILKRLDQIEGRD